MSKAAGIQANSIRAQRRLLPVVQQRLVQVSNLLGFALAELSTEALAGQTRLSGLSTERRWTMDEMVALYNVSAADCIKYLLQLDKLRIRPAAGPASP